MTSLSEDMTKECRVCKRTLPLLTGFHKWTVNKDGHKNKCKVCTIKATMEYDKKHPGKRKVRDKKYRDKHKKEASAFSKAWLKKHPEKKLEYAMNGYKRHLRVKFGLTIQDYDDMYIEQGGCCAICGVHQSETQKRLCIDHNHETGNVRGLLCDRCNTSIGKFNDDINLLRNAIKYLEGDKP